MQNFALAVDLHLDHTAARADFILALFQLGLQCRHFLLHLLHLLHHAVHVLRTAESLRIICSHGCLLIVYMS